jgi:hypothetical protein
MREQYERFLVFQNLPTGRFAALLLLIYFLPLTSGSQSYPDIRPGTLIPKLLWVDNTFKVNLEILNVSKTHVVIREGDSYLTIKHEHLLSLYETTHQNLTSAKINMEANNLGGAKPGIPSKMQIEPGYVFPQLLWANGEMKRLVEVLNIKQGYYVLRVDGKTVALSQEKFLKVLQKTKDHFKGNADIVNVQPEKKQSPLTTVPKAPKPSLKLKPDSSGLGAPPKPSKVTPSGRPVEFDFKFKGDSARPIVKE